MGAYFKAEQLPKDHEDVTKSRMVFLDFLLLQRSELDTSILLKRFRVTEQ